MTPSTFMKVFLGSDVAHGRTELTGKTNERGKAEAKCWTVRKPATQDDFEAHLAGRRMLGMPPIDSHSMCRWGAIDVDEYESDSNELLRAISERDLPLVPFRSKSGGLHIYLFMTEAVPAAWMLATLESFAASMGLSRCEIFPKQKTISSEEGAQDVGNWLNLPYFGEQRWAIGHNGEPVPPHRFMAEIYSMRVIPQEAIEKKGLGSEDTEFPDGPPCLNAIFGRRATQDYRNISLSNLAVYMKRAHPDSWKDRVHEYNRKFERPLDRSEVDGTILRSHAKRDYKYQCGTEPLCRYCDSHSCRTRRHGVGNGAEALAANRSLTMVRTDPPIWYLDVTREDGQTRRIRLTTEELQSPVKFQLRAMEVLQEMPKLAGRDEWHQTVAALMKKHNIIEVPPEATPKGLFREELNRFMQRAQKDGFSGIIRGLPYDDGDFVWFSASDMFEYMANRKFVKMEQRDMQLALKDFGALHEFKKIDRKGMNLWKMKRPEDASAE